jgi:hypothetical protein
VNVFSLDRHLIREYASFARSFTKIRAHDIAEQVERIYSQGTFWPEPLVSINPHYQSGSTLTELVRDGDLCADIENVFMAVRDKEEAVGDEMIASLSR